MRKFFLIALVTLGASFAGTSFAQAQTSHSATSQSSSIDGATLEHIYEAVACNSDMCISEAREAYAEGRMEIQKADDVYLVTVVDADGGIMDVVIADNL